MMGKKQLQSSKLTQQRPLLTDIFRHYTGTYQNTIVRPDCNVKYSLYILFQLMFTFYISVFCFVLVTIITLAVRTDPPFYFHTIERREY